MSEEDVADPQSKGMRLGCLWRTWSMLVPPHSSQSVLRHSGGCRNAEFTFDVCGLNVSSGQLMLRNKWDKSLAWQVLLTRCRWQAPRSQLLSGTRLPGPCSYWLHNLPVLLPQWLRKISVTASLSACHFLLTPFGLTSSPSVSALLGHDSRLNPATSTAYALKVPSALHPCRGVQIICALIIFFFYLFSLTPGIFLNRKTAQTVWMGMRGQGHLEPTSLVLCPYCPPLTPPQGPSVWLNTMATSISLSEGFLWSPEPTLLSLRSAGSIRELICQPFLQQPALNGLLGGGTESPCSLAPQMGLLSGALCFALPPRGLSGLWSYS